MSGRIELREVSIELGSRASRFTAVHRFDATIEAGELICLLGPSGCGKSSLLHAIAGFLRPCRGAILVAGKPVDGPHPERGIVVQQHALFPWKTVEENVAFGPKMRGVGRRERKREALELLELVGLSDFGDRYPSQLSGGMQQRAEIARVLVNRPEVLLMDEPFGALDAQTRLRMQELLLDVCRRVRATVLFVTHDIDEALFLADRVILMSGRPGRVREILAVDFARPRTADVLTTAPFMTLKRRCFDALRAEALAQDRSSLTNRD